MDLAGAVRREAQNIEATLGLPRTIAVRMVSGTPLEASPRVVVKDSYEKTYIVSGYMRSGTSALMQALIAGGMAASHDPRATATYDRYLATEEYQPNPHGFWELTARDYRSPGFPKDYGGSLIKWIWPAIMEAPAGNYAIAFMRRNPEEILLSHHALFKRQSFLSELYPMPDDLDLQLAEAIALLRDRPDCDVVEVRHRDLMAQPVATLRALAVKGWPFDPEKGAAAIDRKLWRFRQSRIGHPNKDTRPWIDA